MRKYILPPTGGAYKANLHCHSTISDGRCSVEELKKQYMQKGYSIIAYTDHDVLVDHRDLCDENFLALNGYEMEVNGPAGKTCHMCLIAKDQDNLTQVCYNKDKYIWGNALAFKPGLKFYQDDYERKYTHEGICDMMKKGRDAGFFVTYNHPAWSLEDYTDYSGYEGMNAMEIWNTGCVYAGYDDYNPQVYDVLLRQGKRIFCTAADDNHNGRGFDSPHCDSFGGWVVIRCEKLEYKCVTDALEAGSFYASMGPEIYDLYVEDGYVYVTTSPAHAINYMTGVRHTACERAHYGETVTKAKFAIKEGDRYFRIDVIDDYGRHANTNAVWIDTL